MKKHDLTNTNELHVIFKSFYEKKINNKVYILCNLLRGFCWYKSVESLNGTLEESIEKHEETKILIDKHERRLLR